MRRSKPAASAVADDAQLTGRDIYDRVLRNRFDAFSQESQLISGDRGGREQESRLQLTWQSFRDENGQPTRGVLSKTLVRYIYPFDVRFSGYLVIRTTSASTTSSSTTPPGARSCA